MFNFSFLNFFLLLSFHPFWQRKRIQSTITKNLLFGTNQYTTTPQVPKQVSDMWGSRCHPTSAQQACIPHMIGLHQPSMPIYTSTSKHGIWLCLISKGSSRNSGYFNWVRNSKKIGERNRVESGLPTTSPPRSGPFNLWLRYDRRDKGRKLFFF